MFGSQIDKLVNTDIAGIPVGRGGYLAAGRGVSQAVIDLLQGFGVPPVASGLAGAWATNNLAPVRRWIGSSGAYDLSSIMVMESINNQFDLTNRINDLVSNITDMLPGGGGGGTAGLDMSGFDYEPFDYEPIEGPAEVTGQLPSSAAAPSTDLYDEFMESRHAG